MKPIITILGSTATGKTALAVALAVKIDGEIVSADSRQVYKEMNIGTGKDLADYSIDNKKIKYHVIDIVEPGIEYNVFQYQQAAMNAVNNIQERGKTAILCGGSGMYIEALLKGYKLFPVSENINIRSKCSALSENELFEILSSYKTLHNRTDIDTRERAVRAIEIEEYYKNNSELLKISEALPSYIFGITGNRNIIRKKITQRLYQRLEEGMIDEVKMLINKGVNSDQLIRYGLEYKYITWYVKNIISYNEMVEKLKIAIHQFSKRQMTWFRKMERSGFVIHWLDVEQSLSEKLEKIENILQKDSI